MPVDKGSTTSLLSRSCVNRAPLVKYAIEGLLQRHGMRVIIICGIWQDDFFSDSNDSIPLEKMTDDL